MPLKWKIYRIANYFLLCCSIIIFLFNLRLIFNAPDTELQVFSVLFALPFLLMSIHSLVNITIMVRTFPDKMIAGNNHKWHVLSIVLSLLSTTGLLIMFFSLVVEIRKDYFGGLLLMLSILTLLLLVSVFVLVCLFSIKKYLKIKSMSLMNSWIDSIGTSGEAPD